MAAGIAIQVKGGQYIQSYLPLFDNIEIGNTRMGFLLRAVAGIVISSGIFSIIVSLMGIVGACRRMVLLLVIVSSFYRIVSSFIHFLFRVQAARHQIIFKLLFYQCNGVLNTVNSQIIVIFYY